MDEKQKLVHNIQKSLIIILIYFLYSQVFGSIISSVFKTDLTANWLMSMVLDLLFLVFCVYAYNDEINEDFKELKENTKKKVMTIIKYVGLTFLITIACGIIGGILESAFKVTFSLQNDESVHNLNVIYRVFRTLIFATIAETIIYNQTIRKMTEKHKFIYVIVTSLFYALMNIIYQPIHGLLDLYIVLFYFARIIPYCLLHIKTENIVMIMIMKFIYNFIVLVVSLFKGLF